MLAIVLLAGAGQISAQVRALKFGKVWDGSGKVLTGATILVEKDRIRAVGGGIAIPEGADLIDLSRYTAIPGLIDAHAHMTYFWDPARGTPQSQANRPAAAIVYLSQQNARKTLETGVTTVRNLGASDYADVAMRDLIREGHMPGPRMFVSGHGLLITRNAARPGATPQYLGTADGVTEVMRVVRQQIAAGADWVKMFGSTGSGQDVSGYQTFTFDEMKAAVDAAHALGKRIAIHSYGPSGARDAVRAGADSVEHATGMDDETIQQMVKRGTFYVPTIDHNRYYLDNGARLGYAPGYAERLKDYIARNLETARKAFRAGVRIAMGSDAVYSMFGENTRELGWFVKAGLTPEQALRTATTNGAELLGMEESLGALAAGYYADIVAVEGDPLSDINIVIEKVKWVMKGGVVVVDKK